MRPLWGAGGGVATMLQSTATAASVSFIAHNFNFKSLFSQCLERNFQALDLILKCRFFDVDADFEITALVFIADKSFDFELSLEKLQFFINI